MLRGHGGRAELVASFVLVLGLVLWGRARCLRCNYISDTIPMLPYPGVVLVAVLGAALFYRGMVRGAPRHARAPAFRAAVGFIAACLALTLIVTLPMSQQVHVTCSFLAFGGLLVLLTWDAWTRRNESGGDGGRAALAALWLLLLAQLACYAGGHRRAGPCAQALLILGLWLYVALAWCGGA